MGILALSQTQSTKNSLWEHACYWRKNIHKWEKSTVPFQKIISQSLLINHLMKGDGHQLDSPASFTKGKSSKEAEGELD